MESAKHQSLTQSHKHQIYYIHKNNIANIAHQTFAGKHLVTVTNARVLCIGIIPSVITELVHIN